VKQCDWCIKYFQPSVSYQIYCSIECREKATKEKIAERHRLLKHQKRLNKTRVCKGGCGTSLSIYNDESFCNSCSINIKDVNLKLKEIKNIIRDNG
jgi:hypothetical protein